MTTARLDTIATRLRSGRYTHRTVPAPPPSLASDWRQIKRRAQCSARARAMPIWLDMAPRTDIKGPARLQLAAGIQHARYVELPSADHLPWLADAEAIGAEIERLVAEPGPAVEPDGDDGRARAVAEAWSHRGVSRGGPRGNPPVPRADAIRGRPVRGRLGAPHVTLAAARSSPAAPARA